MQVREGQTQEQHRESRIGPVQNKHCTSDTGVIYCDGRNKTENKHLVYSWSGMYLSVTVVTKSSSFQISNWAAALLRLQVSRFTYFSLVIHNKPLLVVCSGKKKDKQHIVSTDDDAGLFNTQEDHKTIMISGN